MRYRLRTLLIVLALGPPVLAAVWLVWAQWPEDRLEATNLGATLVLNLAIVVGLIVAMLFRRRPDENHSPPPNP